MILLLLIHFFQKTNRVKMTARYVFGVYLIGIYLMATLQLVKSQHTSVQACQGSSKDIQCLMDYIAYQSTPEQFLLQQIHSEAQHISKQINDETRQILEETKDISLRLQSLQSISASSAQSGLVSETTTLAAESECERRPRDCRDVQRLGNTVSGVYTIYPFLVNTPIEVYCDLYEDGGGWIVFQRRRDGSVNFTRNWNDYKNGFGEPAPHQELWLGNEYLHAITDYNTQELRIDLGAWDGSRAFAKYTRFHVSSEERNYTLYLGDYSGNAGDSLAYQQR